RPSNDYKRRGDGSRLEPPLAVSRSRRIPRARNSKRETLLTLQDFKRFESFPNHILTRHAKPAIQDRGVDLAKIGVMLQIAILNLCQAGVRADDAGLDLGADQEHRRGRAVIGSLAAVLLGAAA